MDEEKEYKEKLKEEIELFLAISNKEDAKIMINYKKKDGTEDIARIATLTVVFGFKRLFFKIMANMGEAEANECLERIAKVKNDFETINKWVREFVSKSINEGLKEWILGEWEKYVNEVDRATFSLDDLFRADIDKFKTAYLIK